MDYLGIATAWITLERYYNQQAALNGHHAMNNVFFYNNATTRAIDWEVQGLTIVKAQ